ncbi:BPTI/Kunitz domain-containing protein 5-like [Drosophila biarmipes]|uniref:BPTI/Kunitz domain-containing protein 5-like n=1 Tax=Drosophila biarmipes TaxID=125945 RepID=UPI0007E82DCD|nr:BPTI/Kunitz domain-containing protein 5-like [Drosophila biarmipes]
MRSTTLALMAVVVVLYLTVEVRGLARCKGKPGTSKCTGHLDGGNNRKRKCKKSANKDMWHYNAVTKRCTKLNYLGCGGNANRWCTKVLCEGCRPRNTF